MKYSMIIKSVAGAGILLGSLNVMATGYGGDWSRDSHTGTLINANAPGNSSTRSATAMKSKQGSEFGNGWTKNSHTGTLTNANAPSYDKAVPCCRRQASHSQQLRWWQVSGQDDRHVDPHGLTDGP